MAFRPSYEVPVPSPTPGRIVWFTNRNAEYYNPAIVVATRNMYANNLYRPYVDQGFVPDLHGELHVHLWVFSPGEAGGYQEHDVPYSPEGRARTWRWPDRF